MSRLLAVPKASEDAVIHADWLELRALEANDGSASLNDLAREIARAGTTDATMLAVGEKRRERATTIAEDAIKEIEDRIQSADGNAVAYPFCLNKAGQLLSTTKGAEDSLYVFLLLLTHVNIDKAKVQAGIDGTQLFEDVCAEAATGYLGGSGPRVQFYAFGFPRRSGPKAFGTALDTMCSQMGEGVGLRARDNAADMKDAALDLAVWRSFGDRRAGKLIGFAQCKTGRNWEGEVHNLRAFDFCANWLRDMPLVLPVRMFFVPCRVSHYGRDAKCRAAGILFDRCRITEYASSIADERAKQWRKWSKGAITNLILKPKRVSRTKAAAKKASVK
ncbi:MAG TPA: hypothetical protein VMF69_12780 [Gemmataceae bacterium]|nr:hypothetical protein [Gemmataceae bacterium]